MLSRFCSAVVLSALLLVPVTAQTVRFDTNVGTFDMKLNPTGNANLQGHVDNMLAYVEAGRYDLTVINRADTGAQPEDRSDDFVMQMGGFRLLDSLNLPSNFGDFPSVPTFDPLIVDADNDGAVDFDVATLLNTRGTVSLALSSSANTGTSSFFINLGDNPSLDSANLRFVPFASISDMATIDLILGLQQADLGDGGLGGDNVPLLDNSRVIFVERAFVLQTPEQALAAALGSSSSLQSVSVPEPPALLLAVGALVLVYAMKPSKRR